MKLERSAKIKQKVGLNVERGLGQLLELHLQRIGKASCMDFKDRTVYREQMTSEGPGKNDISNWTGSVCVGPVVQ